MLNCCKGVIGGISFERTPLVVPVLLMVTFVFGERSLKERSLNLAKVATFVGTFCLEVVVFPVEVETLAEDVVVVLPDVATTFLFAVVVLFEVVPNVTLEVIVVVGQLLTCLNTLVVGF